MSVGVEEALTQVSMVADRTSEKPKKLTLVVMSGDMDRVFGAFIIATGAKAMGFDVVMFFTFWGLRAIKRADAKHGTSLFGRMLGLMYGGGVEKANPSKFSFGGMGRWMFGKMMGAHNVATLPELRDLAVDLGVRMYGCQMSMDVMEIPQEAFVKGVLEPVGVGFMLAEAEESQVQFFI
ncbi:MAG TPA: DsrE/DsrF/DrsH-like family protein [Coriobacteriia bacterium]|nr:DsrE/DsrF/DrsH-like family protein [Coriobacteriia bacterium]